jgi:hypothetical protein
MLGEAAFSQSVRILASCPLPLARGRIHSVYEETMRLDRP